MNSVPLNERLNSPARRKRSMVAENLVDDHRVVGALGDYLGWPTAGVAALLGQIPGREAARSLAPLGRCHPPAVLTVGGKKKSLVTPQRDRSPVDPRLRCDTLARPQAPSKEIE